ncbi:hypothetical protein [Natrinema sp. 1APR25-10V2]|nr:hypothetical protein [Natrinema sp. 1APR25-10V2]MDS0474036.1 hypothetical protein [Natrinema sp. 1APR25-10V2]
MNDIDEERFAPADEDGYVICRACGAKLHAGDNPLDIYRHREACAKDV